MDDFQVSEGFLTCLQDTAVNRLFTTASHKTPQLPKISQRYWVSVGINLKNVGSGGVL